MTLEELKAEAEKMGYILSTKANKVPRNIISDFQDIFPCSVVEVNCRLYLCTKKDVTVESVPKFLHIYYTDDYCYIDTTKTDARVATLIGVDMISDRGDKDVYCNPHGFEENGDIVCRVGNFDEYLGLNNLDRLILNDERGVLQWIYYNPDSCAGGQYIINYIKYHDIALDAKPEEFFDCLNAVSYKVELIDKGTVSFMNLQNWLYELDHNDLLIGAAETTRQIICHKISRWLKCADS